MAMNFQIRTRLIFIVILFLAGILILSTFGYYGMTRWSSNMKIISENRIPALLSLSTMNKERMEIRAQTLSVYELTLLNGDRTAYQKIQETRKQSWKVIDDNYDLFQKIPRLTKKGQELADELIPLYEAWRRSYIPLDDLLEKFASTGDVDRRKRLIVDYKNYVDLMIPASEEFGKKLDEMYHTNSRNTETMVEEDVEASVLGVRIIFLVATLVILTGTAGSYLAIRSILRPLNSMVERVHDIAQGEGDLTRRLEIRSQDELGHLGNLLNTFIETVHTIVKDIAKTTESVYQSSSLMSESSQSLSAGIEEMSTQAQSIASSASEMNQNFQIISSAVEEMSISVTEVAKQTNIASSISAEANSTASDASHVIDELGESANEIGKVIESIVNIANQTNLLALNASIEAAGAGDAGRGFAVVASEVKELARQSGESSEDIKRMVHSIQERTGKAIAAIGEISKTIAKVNEVSASIASAVDEQSITSKDIASNIEQSLQASTEVSKNIEGISLVASEGSKNAIESSRIAGELSDLAESLKKIVNRFKV